MLHGRASGVKPWEADLTDSYKIKVIDLEAYLARIRYAGPREPSMNTLAGVVRHHAGAIPFENLDAFLGRAVSLAPGEVEQKLVAGGRGGWCFEQNLLLGAALRAMGFAVTDLAGRVLWNRPRDAVTPRTHRLLCAEADGRRWLVDVGFGGHTITAPLDLGLEDIQQTTHEPFRITRHGRDQLVESLIREVWQPLFRFDLQPQLPIDFEAANYQLAHDPASHFTQTLIASRVVDGGRHVLRGSELAFHELGGETRRETLAGAEAVIAALGDVMGIEVPPPLRDSLRMRLQAVA
jgi:N-hydroxyarylamine O-acetyltransferase